MNEVLQLNLEEVRVIEHKYFSGTWATNVIFSDGIAYSEYNAGSGEFLVALMLDKISRLPENALLLLDEPEVSLHPGAQKRFMIDLFGTIPLSENSSLVMPLSPKCEKPSEAASYERASGGFAYQSKSNCGASVTVRRYSSGLPFKINSA